MQRHFHENNPQSISELKEEIISVISEIEPKLCQNVIENFNRRMPTINHQLKMNANYLFHSFLKKRAI